MEVVKGVVGKHEFAALHVEGLAGKTEIKQDHELTSFQVFKSKNLYLKNLDCPKTLNSKQCSSLNPHIETRSKRLPKMLNSLTESKLKARLGVLSTMTDLSMKA